MLLENKNTWDVTKTVTKRPQYMQTKIRQPKEMKIKNMTDRDPVT